MLYRFGVRRAPLWIAILLAAASLGNTPLKAQFTTASLGGSVTDTSGGLVPSAKITVRNTGTDLTKSMQSGEDGSYLFPILPIGTYTLTVEKSGFKTYLQTGIILEVNQAVTQGVVLQIDRK